MSAKPEVYCCTNDGEVYRAHREKVILEIMKHHNVDRAEATDRLDVSDINNPVTLDNLESAWVE